MSAVAEERWRACQPSVGEKIHHFDYAIRFLLQAADYCIWEDDYNSPYYQFVAYCEEAISLARKYGFEYVLEEKRPKQTLKLFGDILLEILGKSGKMPEKILGESGI